eukprot:119881-Rhodomonas_salina.2
MCRGTFVWCGATSCTDVGYDATQERGTDAGYGATSYLLYCIKHGCTANVYCSAARKRCSTDVGHSATPYRRTVWREFVRY